MSDDIKLLSGYRLTDRGQIVKVTDISYISPEEVYVDESKHGELLPPEERTTRFVGIATFSDGSKLEVTEYKDTFYEVVEDIVKLMEDQ